MKRAMRILSFVRLAAGHRLVGDCVDDPLLLTLLPTVRKLR